MTTDNKKKNKSKRDQAEPVAYSELKRTVGYVYPYFRPYKRRLFWVVLFMLMSSSFEPLGALAVKRFIDDVFIAQSLNMVIYYALAIIILIMIREIFGYFYRYVREKICFKVVQDIRIALYGHFMHLSVDHYDKMSTGEMMSRTQNDVSRMQQTIPLVIDFSQQLVKVIALSAVCFRMEPVLSLIAVTIGPLTVYPILRIGYALKRYTKKGLAQLAVLNVIAQETYSGARVVKAFSMEDNEVDHYTKSNRALLGISYRYARFKYMVTPATNIIGAVAIALIFYFGCKHMLEGTTEASELVAFIFAVGMMVNPIRQLGEINASFQTAYGAAERIRETFEKQSSVIEKPDAIDIEPLKRGIRYEHIYFRYEDEWVLKDFNLEAKKGELVALVGPSGAGKTTVINLLPRFYNPMEGRILIDGIDTRDVTFRSLRGQIGIVTQETFLFNDTVENNIKYGSEQKTHQEVIQVARTANAHNFIMQLPRGYDTVIGERGVRLSGGERQRIAIARALIKNPPILILDEATSSLDTEAEREVQKALDVLMQNRTTIAIAHRLSTVRHANKILVLGEGGVIEEGRHQELMKRGGTYKRLYEMQFFLGEYGPEETQPMGRESLL
jgi:subfamily B ATP-binding cassette protein MsbA